MSSFLSESKNASGGYNVLEYSKPGDALGFLSKDHIRLIALQAIIFRRESLKYMSVHTSCRQEGKKSVIC